MNDARDRLAEIRAQLAKGQWVKAKWLVAMLPAELPERDELLRAAEALSREPVDPRRHAAQQVYVENFAYEVEVHCPNCGAAGKVRWHPGWRFTCSHCLTTISEGEGVCDGAADPPRDPWLGLELRLKARTRHGWVWVYNRDHLRELRAFVQARLRSPNDADPWGCCWTYNAHWSSRLPRWITSAKNRDSVEQALRRIERLG